MKNGKDKKCSECGKPGIICKGLCQACYSRKQRSTPEGKKRLKLYNDTKGKDARARYLAKQQPKPPKQIKICECGEVAVAKGYCFKCYQKYYYRKKHGFNARKKKKEIDITNMFNDILKEVKKGYTISKACINLSITTTFLYSKLSDLQKTELRIAKAIGFVDSSDFFLDYS